MKKVVTIAICALIFVNVSAQTKSKPTLEETANWIVEKFNLCASSKVLTTPKIIWSFGDYKFSYNPENKSIEMTTKQILVTTSTSELSYKYIIPLKEINRIDYTEEQASDVLHKQLNIYCYSNSIEKIEVKTSKIDKINTLSFYFDKEKEADIVNRIQKAIINLKSFFPKKSEAF